MRKKLPLIIVLFIFAAILASFWYKNKKNNEYVNQTPLGAGTSYQNIIKSSVENCGNSIKLLSVTSQMDNGLPPQEEETYAFRAGNCGKNNEIFYTYFYPQTNEIEVGSNELKEAPNLLPLPLQDWQISTNQAKTIAVNKLNSQNITNLSVTQLTLTNKPQEQFEWNIYLNSDQGQKILVTLDPKTGKINNINTNYNK